MSSPRIKNISLFPKAKSAAHLWPSRPTQRASAVVTDVGRVAVDADVTETNVADAYGEVVWSWRPDAGVKLCGEIRAAMVARKPVHQGELDISRKAIAQGRPGFSR